MIITRTPFRVTLGGGGTDLPSYYSRFGGFIFSFALDKYMFIYVNRPIVDDFDNRCFSAFVEIQKQPALNALINNGKSKGDFAKWVADTCFDRNEHVRELPLILPNDDAFNIFLRASGVCA